MNIGFSCTIAGRSGHNFIRLSLHIGDTVLGEGWETLGLTTAALQDVLANLNTLHANPSTTPLRDIRPAQAELYVFTEHNALPYGSSAFDGDCLLLFKSEHHRKTRATTATPPSAKHTGNKRCCSPISRLPTTNARYAA